MQIALIVVLALLIRAAQYVGQLYGWYYHASFLVVLGVSLGALFRLAAPKMPEPTPELPPTDDPEGRKIREFIETAQKDLGLMIPALRRDSMVVPILACVPAAVILCALQQNSYSPEYSLWLRLSFVPVLLYVFVRYIFPKTYKKGA
jgi:hypothetical protein